MHRRGFLKGFAALVAAPVIVRAGSLMPVRGIIMDARRPTIGLLPGDKVFIEGRLFVVCHLSQVGNMIAAFGTAVTVVPQTTIQFSARPPARAW